MTVLSDNNGAGNFGGLPPEISLIGESPEMAQIMQTIQQVAPIDIPVLILGESGTGKELVAEAIHFFSQRREKPFIVVNAGAIPEGIIESELFGHEKGAFTGAVTARKGYFELADTGTLFLDEIGEMPLNAQVKFLRLLEGKDFIRVGGTSNRAADVRVIAATNRDLNEAVADGSFRQDLYYRLNAVKLRVPPLRERREDIPLLVNKFADDLRRKSKVDFEGFTPTAMSRLQEYHWPGNVRQLKNFIESVIVIERGQRLDEALVRKHLPQYVDYDRRLPVPTTRRSDELEREFIYRALVDLKNEIAQLRELLLGRYISPLHRLKSGILEPEEVQEVSNTEVGKEVEQFESLEGMEKRLIQEALERTEGNRRKAAQLLQISERTLYRKIKEFDLPF